MSNLNPPPQQIWGRTDYFPIPGLHNTALLAAGMNPGYIAKVGEGRDSGTITNNLITGKIKMSSITDGSSNTMMVSECGSKPIGYNGFRQIYLSEVNGLPVDGVDRARQQWRRGLGRPLHLLEPGRSAGTV